MVWRLAGLPVPIESLTSYDRNCYGFDLKIWYLKILSFSWCPSWICNFLAPPEIHCVFLFVSQMFPTCFPTCFLDFPIGSLVFQHSPCIFPLPSHMFPCFPETCPRFQFSILPHVQELLLRLISDGPRRYALGRGWAWNLGVFWAVFEAMFLAKNNQTYIFPLGYPLIN